MGVANITHSGEAELRKQQLTKMAMLTETLYEISDTHRRVVLVKRLNNRQNPFYVKSTGNLLPVDFTNLGDAYRYYNTEASKIDQKWGDMKTSY